MTDRFRMTYRSVLMLPGSIHPVRRPVTDWSLTPQDAVDASDSAGWRAGTYSPLLWAIHRARANEDPEGWRHPAPVFHGLEIERSPWPPHPSGAQVIGQWVLQRPWRLPATIMTLTAAIGLTLGNLLMQWAMHR